MRGQTTIAYNPFSSSSTADDAKEFTFDYSYWSHDDFVEDDFGYRRPVDGSNYADQVD
jgi:hypothetical protein